MTFLILCATLDREEYTIDTDSPSVIISEYRAIADLVHISTSADGQKTYLLTRVNVPAEHRGKGIGSRLLRNVTAMADQADWIVDVHPVSSGPLNRAALYRWYRRYGWTRNTDGTMTRYPNPPTNT